MSEKKSKPRFLILVLSLTVSAFVTGLIVGLSIQFPRQNLTKPTLSAPDAITHSFNQIHSNNQRTNSVDTTSQAIPQNQKESLNRYKKMLEKNLESKLDHSESQKRYGVVINTYSTLDEATNQSIQLKSEYADWNISVYQFENTYQLIVGSFENKKDALRFLKAMPKRATFLKAKITLLPTQSE